MPPPERLTADAVPLTERLLAETREELGKADGKAQILLAASGVVIGVVLGGAIGGDWSPANLQRCARVIWWIGVGAAALGIGALGFAIFPRLLQSDNARITYFEDVLRHRDCAALTDALNSEAERGDRDVEQLLRLSRVAHRKYAAVQVAISALLVAILFCSAAALLG
jgi:hypothetical protein